MIRDGEGAQLYDLRLQYQVQMRFAPNVDIRQVALPYNHPPFEALLFLPLACLKFFPAYLSVELAKRRNAGIGCGAVEEDFSRGG